MIEVCVSRVVYEKMYSATSGLSLLPHPLSVPLCTGWRLTETRLRYGYGVAGGSPYRFAQAICLI